MILGYAGLSTDGQRVDVPVRELRDAACEKIHRDTASGAKTDRAQLWRVLDQVAAGDVLMVAHLDHLARSTRDLINAFAIAPVPIDQDYAITFGPHVDSQTKCLGLCDSPRTLGIVMFSMG